MTIHSSSLACRIHGQRSLVDCSPWGGKQSETTKWLTHSTLLYLQYDLEIYPSYLSKRNGAFFHTKTCLQVFIEVLFIIVLTWTKSSIFQVVNELKKKSGRLTKCNLLSNKREHTIRKQCGQISKTPYYIICNYFVVQLLGHVQPSMTPWTAAGQDSLSFTISQSLFKLMPI